MLKYLLEGCMIFNCDESSFDRSVRENYSWLTTGIGESIIGEPVGEKNNLILSILPNGAWIAMILDGTTNFQAFSFYLAVLSKVMEKSNKSGDRILKILIDNAAIHHSNATKQTMRTLGKFIFHLIDRSKPDGALLQSREGCDDEIIYFWEARFFEED